MDGSTNLHSRFYFFSKTVSFREKLHASGIKLMLDFVPNHLALDNAFLPEHPEYFISICNDEWSLSG